MSKQPSLVKKKFTESEVIEFLKERGYSVVKEVERNDRLNECDILNVFKTLLIQKTGQNFGMIYQTKDSSEKKAIKDFIAKAEELKIPRKEAFLELKSSIELVFKYYDKLGLTSDITSLKFILSKDGSWILEKAAKVHKETMIAFENSSDGEVYKEQFYDFEDEELIKLREKRHKKILGEGNGKKEN